MNMKMKLLVCMHVLMVGAVFLAAVALIGNELSFDEECPSCGMGPAMFYGALYMMALLMAFCGWVAAVAVLLRRDRISVVHRCFAVVYLMLGAGGLGYAFYLMQRS